ncbi:MAG: hypothetical protein K0Q47_103 [Sedimentibacter sp.]|jgi:hypothetical protein|nr:hypothetical protein [Sedimentibacter sp.]
MAKYCIHPGVTISKNDGQFHYISSSRLISLYGVNPSDCIISSCDERNPKRYPENIIHLYPDYKGNYDLKEVLRENNSP